MKIASQAAHVDENRPISGRLGRSWGRPIRSFAARYPCFPWYAGPGIPPRRYAARRLSPLVVVKQKQLEGFFYAVVQGGAIAPFRDNACQTDGFRGFSHLYYGGDMQSLWAEYSEPNKGHGEEGRVIKRSSRGNLSARVQGPMPSAGVFPSVRDNPDFAVFLGRVCDAGTEEACREAH